MTWWRWLAVVGALGAQTVTAQELRVRVAEPGRNLPVIGALLRLESGSRTVATAVTNDFARARFQAPAGDYQLVVERPGFLDTTYTVSVPAGLDSVTVLHAARRPGLPTSLAAPPAVCRSPAFPDALQSMWTEVDRALRVVTATETLGVITMSLTGFERTLSWEQRLERQEVNTILGAGNRPSAAADAATLARDGVFSRSDSARWVTPSVATFLSPEFRAANCFGAVNGTEARPEYLGLRFVPASANGVQLTGTFWIDRSSRELKVIDYAFAGIDKSWRPDKAGGSIEIHRFNPGFWITRFWYQREPNVIRAKNGKERVETFREHGAEVVNLTAVIDTTDRVVAASAIIRQQEELRRRFARMDGIVQDSLGYAVREAEVAILGTEIQTVTDTAGRFSMAGLPLGLQVVRARKIGYKVTYTPVRLASGEEWKGKIVVRRLPQILAEIVVVGKWGKPAKYANTAKYDEFYRRRSGRVGRYLTREEIDRRRAVKVSQLLTGMLGLRVGYDRPGGDEIEFATCPAFGISVWIDGQRLTGTVNELLRVINPSDVEAMEVYSRESQVPAEFRDNSCAAIVMWTR